MSNKSQLQTNNATLDSLITRVNTAKDVAASLPEAGSGGGESNAKAFTITITNQVGGMCFVHFLDKEGNFCHYNTSGTYEILHGAMLIESNNSDLNTIGECVRKTWYSSQSLQFSTDGSVTISEQSGG